MASLFKLRVTRYVDEAGRRVRKATPGARVVRQRSRKWYGEYRDATGHTRRVALSTDKAAAQAMLNDLVRKAERESAGLLDPYEEHLKRPLLSHLEDYENFLAAKGDSTQHVGQTISRVRKVVLGCGFKQLSDLDAPAVADWLSQRRTSSKRFSAQTSNFYLDSLKYFCNWLVVHSRLPRNPLATLKRVQIETDRRHDRRALTVEKFRWLIEAAESGRRVEGVEGPDRAMLYLLAAWTGYRRRELGSLTRRSLDFDSTPPVLRVQAADSKRRREDVVPLHPYVVKRLREWLAGKADQVSGVPLFALRTPKGDFRRTSKMMRRDLGNARKKWIEEAESPEERERRTKSDFLCYRNKDGLFADFHANRHTFISNLSRAGVPLAVSQKLARHSDPRLTANRYTHLELGDQAAAIATLPAPGHQLAQPVDTEATSNRCYEPVPAKDETLVAGMVAGEPDFACQRAADDGNQRAPRPSERGVPKSHGHEGC